MFYILHGEVANLEDSKLNSQMLFLSVMAFNTKLEYETRCYVTLAVFGKKGCRVTRKQVERWFGRDFVVYKNFVLSRKQWEEGDWNSPEYNAHEWEI